MPIGALLLPACDPEEEPGTGYRVDCRSSTAQLTLVNKYTGVFYTDSWNQHEACVSPGLVDNNPDLINQDGVVDDDIAQACSDFCIRMQDDIFYAWQVPPADRPAAQCAKANWQGLHPGEAASGDGRFVSGLKNADAFGPFGENCRIDTYGYGSPSITWPDGTVSSSLCSPTGSCSDAFFGQNVRQLFSRSQTPGERRPRGELVYGFEADALDVDVSHPGASTLGLGSLVVDRNELESFAEFMPAECGQDVCPFLLTNLSFKNLHDDSGDTWNLRFVVDTDGGNVRVDDIDLQLLAPVMGYWRPATGDVAFLPNTVVTNARFNVDAPVLPVSGAYDEKITFEDTIFGSWTGARLELDLDHYVNSGLPADFGDLDVAIHLGLWVSASPPQITSVELGEELNCIDGGYTLPDPEAECFDLDDDLASALWWSNGAKVPSGHLPLGHHDLRLSAADTRGTRAASSFTVDVVDTSSPSVGCSGLLLECTGPTTPADVGCVAHDVCDGELIPADDAPASFPLGVSTVHCSATDHAGLTGAKACNVEIHDTQAPDVTCTDATVQCTGPQTTVVPTCAAFDSCAGVLTATDSLPDTLPVGTQGYTCTATDTSGLSDSASCNVQVLDAQLPVFTFVPPALAITKCVGANIGQAVAADTCDTHVIVSNNAPAKFPLGTTIVTWSARDASGNVATATQQVSATLDEDVSCCPSQYHVIAGTSGSDQLIGSAGADCIVGKAGDDVIDARDGNDLVAGGRGNDVIFGGNGNDTIIGGAGVDTCSAAPGLNQVSCEVSAG